MKVAETQLLEPSTAASQGLHSRKLESGAEPELQPRQSHLEDGIPKQYLKIIVSDSYCLKKWTIQLCEWCVLSPMIWSVCGLYYMYSWKRCTALYCLNLLSFTPVQCFYHYFIVSIYDVIDESISLILLISVSLIIFTISHFLKIEIRILLLSSRGSVSSLCVYVCFIYNLFWEI